MINFLDRIFNVPGEALFLFITAITFFLSPSLTYAAVTYQDGTVCYCPDEQHWYNCTCGDELCYQGPTPITNCTFCTGVANAPSCTPIFGCGPSLVCSGSYFCGDGDIYSGGACCYHPIKGYWCDNAIQVMCRSCGEYSPSDCKDSDGGVEIDTQILTPGHVDYTPATGCYMGTCLTRNKETHRDTCIDEEVVREYYCTQAMEYGSRDEHCPYNHICTVDKLSGDAYCRPKEPPVCIDSDNSKTTDPSKLYFNPGVQGTCKDQLNAGGLSDQCIGDSLQEYYCTLDNKCNSELNDCEKLVPGSTCVSGRCELKACSSVPDGVCPSGCSYPSDPDCPPKPPSCNDDDGGSNYNYQGSCIDSSGSKTDTCLDASNNPAATGPKLREYYCSGSSCTSEDVSCTYGCSYGKCDGPPGSACSWSECYPLPGGSMNDFCYGKAIGPNCICKSCPGELKPVQGCDLGDRCMPGLSYKCCDIGGYKMCIGCYSSKGEEICCNVGCCQEGTFCYNDRECVSCKDAIERKMSYTNFTGSPYCQRCDHCSDNILNCGETSLDCGATCSRPGVAETTAEPAPTYMLEEIQTGGQYQLSNTNLTFNPYYFCYDGRDNDKDCLTDCADPDCALAPNCLCNNNGKCESCRTNSTLCQGISSSPSDGETQESCPNDCYTIVNVTPNHVFPGQEVNVTIYFNDSRYLPNEDAKVNLIFIAEWLSGTEYSVLWNSSTDCDFGWKKWSEMGWSGKSGSEWTCSGNKCNSIYGGKPVEITSLYNYAKIEGKCKIPREIFYGGIYKLRAIPIIYSEPKELKPGDTYISVESQTTNSIYEFFIILNNALTTIFKMIFRMFI